MLVADLIYADDYTADGKSGYDYPAIYRKGSLNVTLPVKASTYQPRQASCPLLLLCGLPRTSVLETHMAHMLHKVCAESSTLVRLIRWDGFGRAMQRIANTTQVGHRLQHLWNLPYCADNHRLLDLPHPEHSRLERSDRSITPEN